MFVNHYKTLNINKKHNYNTRSQRKNVLDICLKKFSHSVYIDYIIAIPYLLSKIPYCQTEYNYSHSTFVRASKQSCYSVKEFSVHLSTIKCFITNHVKLKAVMIVGLLLNNMC